jgi:hypothetical protein
VNDPFTDPEYMAYMWVVERRLLQPCHGKGFWTFATAFCRYFLHSPLGLTLLPVKHCLISVPAHQLAFLGTCPQVQV